MTAVVEDELNAIVERRTGKPKLPELEDFVGLVIQDILNPSERGYSMRTLLTCVLQEWYERGQKHPIPGVGGGGGGKP